ncbi:hypothetical protein Fmac_028765 [Flemingia macrophylla]|uniref:Uncharacterized protein n=1 Tax=Flemingia macrophylla TaxID=520843 RepID=A0ABD1L8F4_9FABA
MEDKWSTLKSDIGRDIGPISKLGDFGREFITESRKLWYLAGLATFSFISKYSLGAFTQIFAGHVGYWTLSTSSVCRPLNLSKTPNKAQKAQDFEEIPNSVDFTSLEEPARTDG